MKNYLKANAKLIKGGIQYLKGKVLKNRADKIKGMSNMIDGAARLKMKKLLK